MDRICTNYTTKSTSRQVKRFAVLLNYTVIIIRAIHYELAAQKDLQCIHIFHVFLI